MLVALPFAFDTPNITPAAAEVQAVSIVGTPTSGTWQLAFQGEKTATLAYNIVSEDLEDALEVLTGVGVGNVAVSGSNPTFTVTFGGDMGSAPWPLITVERIAFGGGTTPHVTVSETTRGSVGYAVLYTPTEGDALTFTAASVTTAFDGSTPKGTVRTLADSDALFAAVIDLATPDGGGDDLSTFTKAGTGALAGAFLTASPIVITIDDGMGADPGNTMGEGAVYLRVDTPA